MATVNYESPICRTIAVFKGNPAQFGAVGAGKDYRVREPPMSGKLSLGQARLRSRRAVLGRCGAQALHTSWGPATLLLGRRGGSSGGGGRQFEPSQTHKSTGTFESVHRQPETNSIGRTSPPTLQTDTEGQFGCFNAGGECPWTRRLPLGGWSSRSPPETGGERCVWQGRRCR